MDLIQLVTLEPEDYHLIKTKRDFISQWYLTLEKTDFSLKGENNVLNQLLSMPKKIEYTKQLPDIPIFLPIVEQYLHTASHIKSENFLDTKYQKKETLRKSMFGTFITFLDDKGVDFTDYNKDQNPLLGILISRIIQWDRKKFNSWMLEEGLIYEKFNALNLNQKLDVMSYIKNDWDIVWSDKVQADLKEHFIYSGFSDEHTIFTFFNSFFTNLAQENLPSSFFDEKLDKIKHHLEEFSGFSKQVDNFIKTYNYLKLDSKVKLGSNTTKLTKKI